MKDRCLNPMSEHYSDYGGRGIVVCDEWTHSFSVFRQWAIDKGYGPKLEIDRKDNDGPYSPENCQWIKHGENCRNKRSNIRLTAWAETKILKEWSRDSRCQIGYGGLYKRFQEGAMTPEEMIATPSPERNPMVRLTSEQIAEIKRRAIVGTVGGDRRSPIGLGNRGNTKELAKEFGVNRSRIASIAQMK